MGYPIYSKEDLYFAERDGNHEVSTFSAFVEDIITHELFDHPAEKGVLTKVSANGTTGLSPKQKEVLDIVVNRYEGQECGRCNATIEWEELIEAHYNGGYCSYCNYQIAKDD